MLLILLIACILFLHYYHTCKHTHTRTHTHTHTHTTSHTPHHTHHIQHTCTHVHTHSYRVYCVMGDGESAEGSIWEAASFAGYYKLDNLVGIIDVNRYTIDTATWHSYPPLCRAVTYCMGEKSPTLYSTTTFLYHPPPPHYTLPHPHPTHTPPTHLQHIYTYMHPFCTHAHTHTRKHARTPALSCPVV